MSFNEVIMFIMAIGVIIGGVDRILGNKFGLGKQFEEGFMCFGPTALSMVGIICLAPVIADILEPIVVPAFNFIGVDPAMFGSILALDMGGYPLAMELAQNIEVGKFAGLVVASMLGATIVFTIPVGLELIDKGSHPFFAKGLLIGIVPIPIGCIIGGIVMGLPFDKLIINCIPIFLIAIGLMLGLVYMQSKMVKAFAKFGTGIKIVTTIGLAIAAFTYLTNIKIIDRMPDIMDSMITVSGICIVLLGSLPLMGLMMMILKKPFEKLGEKIGLDAVSIGGILFSCISVLPVFKMIKDMNERGKIVTTAFLVSSMATFSAHLGYTVDAQPDMLLPVVISKLCSATLALLLGLYMTREKEQINNKN